jgi:NADH:ubiquinone oxidoreductase subunit 6 (subunit J)
MTNSILPIVAVYRPLIPAYFTIVARNPIHAILWRIATFLVAAGVLLSQFKMGFIPSLLIIVYIGAIAIRFLFIIMMIPVRDERRSTDWRWNPVRAAVGIVALAYGVWKLILSHMVEYITSQESLFWLQHANSLDFQETFPHLATSEVEGLSISNLTQSDLAVVGTELADHMMVPVMLVGVLLRYVLLGTIVLCTEREH